MDKRRAQRGGGIRRRVMISLAAFSVFIVVLLWLMQIVWLNDFYRWDKTRQIIDAAETIARNIDSEQLQDLVTVLSEQQDMCILILDERMTPLLSSEDTRFCLIHRTQGRELSFWRNFINYDGSTRTELFKIEPPGNVQFDPRTFRGNVPRVHGTTAQSLLCTKHITRADGSAVELLLNAIITPLDSTVSTLRAQLLLITAVVLVSALALAYSISRRVAQPIIETNEAARALSRGQYETPPHGSDYREMAELNRTLAKAAEELSQVERLQHELIANVSHDLRTPLTMIGGYAEVMRDIPGESSAENLQVIIDETNRLTSLVNELLDFSRMQTENLPLHPAPFDLTEAVESIVDRVSHMTAKDGYVIRFNPKEHVEVTADQKRIGQVVYNLLGNALTYTGEDHTVTLTQEKRGDRVRVTVRDTGRGIAPEELPRVWDRYYRTRESHKRAVIGTGLGLSIVRTILERHGAPYGVQSEVGKGTAFWFELTLTEK